MQFVTRVLYLLLLILFSSSVNAETIEWNYNNKASAKGSACSGSDTYFISAGEEMTVVFTKLGIQMSGRSKGRKNIRKDCKVSIPVSVPGGFFLSELDTALTFGYVRTEKARGSVQFSYSLFKQKGGKTHLVGHKKGGPKHVALKELHDKKKIKNKEACSKRARREKFDGRITLLAEREDLDEGIVLQIDGLDIRLESKGVLVACKKRGRRGRKVTA